MNQVKEIFSAIIPRFKQVAGDYPSYPLTVLFFIYLVDEIDTAAFGVLAPEIQDAFNLSDSGFTNIVILNLSVVLLASVPLGYYGDRLPRSKLVLAGVLLAGTFSVGTGLAPTLALLVIARVGNGLGVLVNDPIHRSLLSDFYPPKERTLAFTTHGNSVRLGVIIGPALAGVLGAIFGWRAVFIILALPILAMTYFAVKLKDPVRGQTDDPESAFLAAQERAIPFSRGVRTLFTVQTLRRQYASWLFIGAGFVPLAAYVPLYFEEVFHLSAFERGLVGAVNGAGAFAAAQLAGKWTTGWLAKDLGEPLKRASWVLVAIGPGLVLLAWAPTMWLALPIAFVTTSVGAMFVPPFITVQALVSPARVRTLSFSFGSLFIVVGLLALFIFPAANRVIDNHGERWGLFTLFPYWVIGGLVLRSGHKFVTTDVRRALDNLQMTAKLRLEREQLNEKAILVVRDVDVSYGPVQVLFGVNMELTEGEIIALLGTNGAGKSTLLRAISGLVPPQGGAIFFDGDDVTGLEPEDSFAAGLVHVPGGRGIFPGLTVRENLEVAAWASRRPKGESAAAVAEVLALFPSLDRRIDQPAAVLSGGEQQMLTLAQAFIAKPKLLMIDELSLGLAPIVVEELLTIVRRIHDAGTSVILVEQSVNLALTVAHRAVFMEKGEIRFSGPTAELLERHDILRAVFLGDTKALEGLS